MNSRKIVNYNCNNTNPQADTYAPDMRMIAFIEDYKVIRKILDYLGIYEFKRYRPPPRALAAADTFDDWRCDDHINNDYMDF